MVQTQPGESEPEPPAAAHIHTISPGLVDVCGEVEDCPGEGVGCFEGDVVIHSAWSTRNAASMHDVDTDKHRETIAIDERPPHMITAA